MNNTNLVKKAFRHDINGLRAIAVLSVLVFHFSHSKLPGGFAGVDVFFVISGFLMTSIIFRGLEKNNFDIIKFWLSRARRIVPALVFTLFLFLVLGYFALGADTYQTLAKHAQRSLLFVSNITYKNESGYFDSDAYQKYFLHTWSLAIEWQFYLIYPIFIVILNRFFSINKVKVVIAVSTVIVFFYAFYESHQSKEYSYFMLHTRAWELLLGGLVFLCPIKITNRFRLPLIIELLGIIIILISFFIITPEMPWPGGMALLPTLGACLVLFANNRHSLLSPYPIKKIGQWSYSIYLLHWPIIVLLRSHNLFISFKWYLIVTLALSFVIYEIIEKKRNYKYGLLLAYLFTLLITTLILTNNYPKAPSFIKEDISLFKYGGHGVNDKKVYNFYKKEHPDYLLIGDSFALQYANYLIKNNKETILYAQSQCLSTRNYYSAISGDWCKERYNKALDILKTHPNADIINAQAWTWMRTLLTSRKNDSKIDLDVESFKNTMIEEILLMKQDMGEHRKYFIIGIPNHVSSNIRPATCLLSKKTLFQQKFLPACSQFGKIKNTDYVEKFNVILKEGLKDIDNVYFINPNDFLCHQNNCIEIKNNYPIYNDGAHFSIYGANYVGDFIYNEIENIKSTRHYQKN